VSVTELAANTVTSLLAVAAARTDAVLCQW
jgi:hypothetical protein